MNKACLNLVRTAIFALGFGIFLSPSTASAQSIFASCDEDLTKFCSAVTPGNGRISACLYAHEDQVSPSCDAAIRETADLIDMLFDRLRYAKEQCGADVAKLCGETEIGHGRLISCLRDQKADLSEGCLEIIEKLQLPSE